MEKTEKPIILELRNITKSFGGNQVLKHIDLAIREGEFVTFLGSSGCGKTTTLRIIAGLEAPDSGAVLLDGADMAEQPPEKRNVNTVFQNYALFPHMDVFQNIAYSRLKNLNVGYTLQPEDPARGQGGDRPARGGDVVPRAAGGL